MFKVIIPALALLSAVSASAQVDPARVVVTVNGEDIKGAEYYRFMEYMDLKDAYNRFRNLMLNFPVGYIALDQMITNRMMAQMAKEFGAAPTEPEVTAELQAYLAENPDSVKDWKDKGRTDAELRERVKFDLIVFKMQTKGITVTDGEVDNFYKTNTTQFTSPKLYKLRLIVAVDIATKDKVDGELKAGKTFADVARAYSDDVTKVTGGEYGSVPLTALPQALSNAVESVKIGQPTDWVLFQGKNLKFMIEDVIAAKTRPLDPVLRKQIRRNLMMDRGKVKNDLGKQLSAFRLRSNVDIKQKEFATIYAKLLEVQVNTGGVETPAGTKPGGKTGGGGG